MDFATYKKLIFTNKWVYLAVCLLCGLAFFEVFHDHLLSYLEQSLDRLTLSLGILVEIKVLLSSIILSKSTSGAESTLAQVIHYLSWSDMIITLQLVLVKLSQSTVFKVFLAMAFILCFVPTYRVIGFKIALVLLVVNPCLPAYVMLVKHISTELHLHDADDLHANIDAIKERSAKREEALKKKEEERDQSQLEKAHEKGKEKVGFFKKLGDKVADGVGGMVNKTEEGVELGASFMKSIGKNLVIKSIDFLVAVFFQFFLLPFLFFWGVYKLLKWVFSQSEGKNQLGNIFTGMTIGVLTALVYMMLTINSHPARAISSSSSGNQFWHSKDSLFGIDVSHFQNEISWDEVKSAGIAFVYTKATQGNKYLDPRFAKNWEDIESNGFRRGAYHFYVAGIDPVEQADFFIKTVGELKRSDLPPVLDLEEAGMKSDIDSESYRKNVFIWLDQVEKSLGIRPMIYTDHPYGSKYLSDPKFGAYQLWIADWEQREQPMIPKAWGGKWYIWQRTDRSKIEGVIGNVDHDLMVKGR